MLYHKNCEHERHQHYLTILDGTYTEYYYLAMVYKFVVDPNLSSEDPEDLELFQDLIFDGPMGRIHIYYYEELFRRFYSVNPEKVITTLSCYLQYLDVLSGLFVDDAYAFVFRQDDPILIDALLNSLSFKLKMSFLREAQKKPGIIQLSDKLKLLNLFS